MIRCTIQKERNKKEKKRKEKRVILNLINSLKEFHILNLFKTCLLHAKTNRINK